MSVYRIYLNADSNSQQDNRIINLPTPHGRAARFDVSFVRARFTVIAEAFFAVFAFVAVEGLSQKSEGIEEGQEPSPARCQCVFDVRRAAAQVVALDQGVALHVTQATDQRAAADGMQRRQQLGRAPRPRNQIAHHEHRPFVAHQL